WARHQVGIRRARNLTRSAPAARPVGAPRGGSPRSPCGPDPGAPRIPRGTRRTARDAGRAAPAPASPPRPRARTRPRPAGGRSTPSRRSRRSPSRRSAAAGARAVVASWTRPVRLGPPLGSILPPVSEQLENLAGWKATRGELGLEAPPGVVDQLVDRVPVRAPVPRELVEGHLLHDERVERPPLAVGEVAVEHLPDHRP